MPHVLTIGLVIGSAWLIGSIPVALLIGGMIGLSNDNKYQPELVDESADSNTQQYINQ